MNETPYILLGAAILITLCTIPMLIFMGVIQPYFEMRAITKKIRGTNAGIALRYLVARLINK